VYVTFAVGEAHQVLKIAAKLFSNLSGETTTEYSQDAQTSRKPDTIDMQQRLTTLKWGLLIGVSVMSEMD
jgi:hypothetical protein